MCIRVSAIQPISNHNLVKALVEVEVAGLRVRGLKLEKDGANQWKLTPPGRSVRGHWQLLLDFVDADAYQDLLRQALSAARVGVRG